MDGMRGLVVSPPIQINGNTVTINSDDLDPQEIRSNLLFWDKLDFPEQNLLGFGLSNDAQFLEGAGILQRTRVHVQSGQLGDILRSTHVEAFRQLDAKEPGQWSIATGERSISFRDNDLDEGRGALVTLYNAIPVPNEDTALADILEFRTKRRAELLALRHHLEDVYQKVISAGDGPLAWNAEVEKLQISINDHIKASREAPIKFRLSDLTASLNLTSIGASVAAAYSMGLPLVPAAIQGAIAGIAVSKGASLKKREATPNPFKYVSSYHKEVF
ncbi:DUF6236 family protein [Mesorhizobium sp. B2-4-8]|uniref:DUF6236 family protein n=1 Tax=Mesorhizobium sp. B2-4-8 TaxID=2589941 RepID=UPI00112B6CE7|nr:DUF6236 family protein [Mesorhizobium sp. B2-4-8]TPL36733.1 hypothetical protein FJ947_10790 [Mesorhizobium sp. B2-4-8]